MKVITLRLPGWHETDVAPLRLLHATLHVVEQILDRPRSCDSTHEPVRRTAHLLRDKIYELLCLLDIYEQQVAAVDSSCDDDVDIPF